MVVAAALNELQIAGDNGQQIVEVVRDTAGKLANGFHFLRLDKRRLGALTLGHLLHQQVVGSGEFVGALADATLEGCVEQPQPLLRRAKLFQVAPRLVLAAASA